MRLLLDLGNTRLKLALDKPGAPLQVHALSHAGGDFLARLQAWIAQHVPAQTPAWLASVAGSALKAMLGEVLVQAGLKLYPVHTQAQALGLRVAYAEPAQLGVDRWLGLLALHVEGCAPSLVASIGTALTIDALGPEGLHLGGLIAPAPQTMREALLARAPHLDLGPGQVQALACTTQDGIESGCQLAAVALIERSHLDLARHLGGEPGLILTGGGAAALAGHLPGARLYPDLVLQGLRHWAAVDG